MPDRFHFLGYNLLTPMDTICSTKHCFIRSCPRLTTSRIHSCNLATLLVSTRFPVHLVIHITRLDVSAEYKAFNLCRCSSRSLYATLTSLRLTALLFPLALYPASLRHPNPSLPAHQWQAH